MFHIFHFLQCNMVLRIANPQKIKKKSWIFLAMSNEKSYLISTPFLSTNIHVRTVNCFPSISIFFSICHITLIQLFLALPGATVRKNLNILHSSACCKQTFSPPPVVAYKRTANLRDLLLRTQLRGNTNPQQRAPLADL